MRTTGELVFAAEGAPRQHIPAHYQMADKNPREALCVSAGNAFFDENNKLVAIDHKSGDFRPTFDSLKFALGAMLNANVSMDEEIVLRQLDYAGALEKNYSIKTEKLAPLAELLIPLPESYDANDLYRYKLEGCGMPGKALLQQIERLEAGTKSFNPYWMNSSEKLNAIISEINKLPPDINEDKLRVIVNDPQSALYKAINKQRILPVTFLGKLGWNNSKSLQAVQKEEIQQPTEKQSINPETTRQYRSAVTQMKNSQQNDVVQTEVSVSNVRLS